MSAAARVDASLTRVEPASTAVTVDRAITALAAVLTVVLTAVAFWLSYEHLQEVAAAHGMADAVARSWAWPATVDLFIVIGELLILRASLAHKVDWWAIGLVTAGDGASIALNVAGVGENANALDYVVAAVPPVAALLAFGALMRQVHAYLARKASTAVTTPPTGVDAPSTPVNVTVDRPPVTPSSPTLPEPVAVEERPASAGGRRRRIDARHRGAGCRRSTVDGRRPVHAGDLPQPGRSGGAGPVRDRLHPPEHRPHDAGHDRARSRGIGVDRAYGAGAGQGA